MLSVDDVLTALEAVSFRWTQCVRFARQVVADHLREIVVQSIGFLNDNDTYADLTPAEERIAAGRDISLLRKMDGLQFSDYFTQADQVEAKNHANWRVTPPTDAFIKAIRRGAYDEAVDDLTQRGFQTNAVAEVTLPWDADATDKTKNKKRVFEIGCALLAGKEVDEVDKEFYSRERKHRRYCTPPPLRYGRGMLRELKRLRERTMSPSMTTSCPTTWRMARSTSQAGWESTTVVWPLTFRLAAWRPVPVPATMWPRLTLEGLVLMTRAMLTSGPTMTAMKTTAATATTAAS